MWGYKNSSPHWDIDLGCVRQSLIWEIDISNEWEISIKFKYGAKNFGKWWWKSIRYFKEVVSYKYKFWRSYPKYKIHLRWRHLIDLDIVHIGKPWISCVKFVG